MLDFFVFCVPVFSLVGHCIQPLLCTFDLAVIFMVVMTCIVLCINIGLFSVRLLYIVSNEHTPQNALRSTPTQATLLLGHVALIKGVACYSHQTFLRTICRSVRRPVQCIVEKRWIGSGCRLAS